MAAAQGKTYTTEEAVSAEMELAELRGERSVVTLQIQTLQQEKEQVKGALAEMGERQKEELEIQQLQHFQVKLLYYNTQWMSVE